MDQLYVKNGIVQKVVSFHAWNVVRACKGECRTLSVNDNDNVSRKEVVQEYLKEYLWTDSIYDEWLYNHLLEVAFEVFDKNKILDIFKREIARRMWYNRVEKKLSGITYENLCEILLNELDLLQVRETKGKELVDLFVILGPDSRMLTIDEAREEYFGSKEAQLKKEFQ